MLNNIIYLLIFTIFGSVIFNLCSAYLLRFGPCLECMLDLIGSKDVRRFSFRIPNLAQVQRLLLLMLVLHLNALILKLVPLV